MIEKLSDEILVAYVDGELLADQTARVEAALSQDAAARELVADLKTLDQVLCQDLNDVAHGLDAGRLKTLIAGGAGGKTWRSPFETARWAPIVATTAALILGLVLGYVTGSSQVESRFAALQGARLQDRALIRATISDALEKVVSGKTVNWISPSTGSRATIQPLRTFKSIDGAWCREYERTILRDGQKETMRAIACRQDARQWKTRISTLGG